MTTLEKETTGCKTCDPELKIKDLKGTIEGLQMGLIMVALIAILLTIGVFALKESQDFWKTEAFDYQNKYHKLLFKSDTVTLSKSTTAWQDSIDLAKAQKQIHKLELEIVSEHSRLLVCKAERGADIAQYEYRLLEAKPANK